MPGVAKKLVQVLQLGSKLEQMSLFSRGWAVWDRLGWVFVLGEGGYEYHTPVGWLGGVFFEKNKGQTLRVVGLFKTLNASWILPESQHERMHQERGVL